MQDRERTFTVLSLNLGSFRVALLGIPVYEAVKYVSQRLAAVANWVAPLNADVLCFQEVFEHAHLERLRQDLFPWYGHVIGDHVSGFNGRIASGLCIFLRHGLEPVDDGEVRSASAPYGAAPLDERLVTNKGAMAVHVFSPLGLTAVVNTHMVSGGAFHQADGPIVQAYRSRQIDRLHRFVPKACRGDVSIITGDLNTGPITSPENYARLLGHGYLDCWDLSTELARHPSVTWDRENILAAAGHDTTSPSDRVDHILIPRAEEARVRVRSCRIVLDKAWAPIGNGRAVPLSDHYGVLATFERRR